MSGSEHPNDDDLGRVAHEFGVPGVSVPTGMRDGRSPWLLQTGDGRVVLRVGGPERRRERLTERAALQLTVRYELPAPRLLAARDAPDTGDSLTLIEHLAESSTIPAALPSTIEATRPD